MLYLIRDVFLHLIYLRWAHRECRVSFLPRELPHTMRVNPHRRTALHLSDDIREHVCGFETEQNVCMVARPADRIGYGIHIFQNSADVGMEIISPGIGDYPRALFCTEDDVIVQTQMRAIQGCAKNAHPWLIYSHAYGVQ